MSQAPSPAAVAPAVALRPQAPIASLPAAPPLSLEKAQVALQTLSASDPGQEKAVSVGRAFEGSLEDLALPDVLQMLHVTRKTGVLILGHEVRFGLMLLKDGQLVGCRHPTDGFNIGKVLTEMALVTQAQIEEAVALQEAAGANRKPLVATLIESGYLDGEAGLKALDKLVEATIIEFINWGKGSFVFEVGDIAVPDRFRRDPNLALSAIGLSTTATILKAMRMLDEQRTGKRSSLFEGESDFMSEADIDEMTAAPFESLAVGESPPVTPTPAPQVGAELEIPNLDDDEPGSGST